MRTTMEAARTPDSPDAVAAGPAPLPRRGALAVAFGAATAALPSGARRATAAAADLLAPVRRAAGMLGGPGLVRSYAVEGGREAFDRAHAETAYTYDNAVAGLALLAGGERALAERLGDGLRLAQAQDRHWRDGRLRNAYAAGRQHEEAPRSARPPGWWDAARGAWVEDGYAAGSATGPVAFAALLWLALDAPRFREAARAALGWVAREHAGGPGGGFTGGTLGHEPAPERQGWVSTEQNLDLAVAFARAGMREEAARAERFVRARWLPDEGRFAAGLRPDGAVDGTSALDASLWPLLAWGDPAHARALDWVLARHGLPSGAPAEELDGVDFNDDRDGTWLEGTAQAALVLRRAGREALAARLLVTVLRHRDREGWVRAASVPWLTTGLRNGEVPFLYPARGHLAANAWGALAALGVSPFGPPPPRRG